MNSTKKMAAVECKSAKPSEYPLYGKWTLYAHLPHDTDWSLDSYKIITTIDTLKQALATCEILPDTMIKNCMLFLMRESIKPTWEDIKNRRGGCFSYKVSNKNAPQAWKYLSYYLMSEYTSSDTKFLSKVTGATISPKKNFCIVKIWMSDCTIQNTIKIHDIPGLDKKGVIFKRHKPEF